MRKPKITTILSICLSILSIATLGANAPVLAVTDPNGNVIIEESVKPVASKEVQDRKNREFIEMIVIPIAAVFVVIGSLGLMLYLYRTKIFKHKKQARKK